MRNDNKDFSLIAVANSFSGILMAGVSKMNEFGKNFNNLLEMLKSVLFLLRAT